MLARRKLIVSVFNAALRSCLGAHNLSRSIATVRKCQEPVHSASAVHQHFQHINYCTSSSNIPNVSFEEVRALKDNTNVLLIDVREPHELRETGTLPSSVNIPLGNVENAFKKLSNDKFKQIYGRDKPDCDFPLVFSCRSGKRSLDAAQTVKRLGYTNVSNYGGGWLDWEEKIKQ